MRFFIKLIAILLVLGALVFTAGTLLPEKHSISRSIELSQQPQEVWDVMIDYNTMVEWNPNTESVAKLKDSDEGNDVWRFEDKRGHFMVLEDVIKNEPEMLVSKITETDYPFGGEWVFEIEATETGSTLTITENGSISNPLLRVLFRYVLGYDKGIEMYEEALQEKLNSLEESNEQ